MWGSRNLAEEGRSFFLGGPAPAGFRTGFLRTRAALAPGFGFPGCLVVPRTGGRPFVDRVGPRDQGRTSGKFHYPRRAGGRGKDPTRGDNNRRLRGSQLRSAGHSWRTSSGRPPRRRRRVLGRRRDPTLRGSPTGATRRRRGASPWASSTGEVSATVDGWTERTDTRGARLVVGSGDRRRERAGDDGRRPRGDRVRARETPGQYGGEEPPKTQTVAAPSHSEEHRISRRRGGEEAREEEREKCSWTARCVRAARASLRDCNRPGDVRASGGRRGVLG